MTNLSWPFSMLLSPYEKSGINSIFVNGDLELYHLILSFYLDIMFLPFDQRRW
jgi:hypothetical protein